MRINSAYFLHTYVYEDWKKHHICGKRICGTRKAYAKNGCLCDEKWSRLRKRATKSRPHMRSFYCCNCRHFIFENEDCLRMRAGFGRIMRNIRICDRYRKSGLCAAGKFAHSQHMRFFAAVYMRRICDRLKSTLCESFTYVWKLWITLIKMTLFPSCNG